MNPEKEDKKYFPLEVLKRLIALEGKTLSDVIYFVWINRIKPESPLVFIDKIQFKFTDGEVITLSTGEENDALQLVENFDPANEALKLDQEFAGKILVKPHNANKDKFWNEITGKKIESLKLSKEGPRYLADAIVLDFGFEKRLIAINPDEGILIDYHEE